MKVSYIEGLANHNGPELCAGVRENMGEALVGGVQARHSASKDILPGAQTLCSVVRQHQYYRFREKVLNPAGSKPLCMYTNSLRGNREIPWLTLMDGIKARVENPNGVQQQ